MSAIGGLQPIQPMAINPAALTALSHSREQNGHPGPSSHLLPSPSSDSASATAVRRVVPAPKRKRTASTEPPDADPSPTSASPNGSKKDGHKKKKASRACALCQKAHLTCDDSRPCQRCTKRGVADQCVEGHRKRAKYLLDEEELEQLKRKKSGEVSITSQVQSRSLPLSRPQPQQQQQQQAQQPQQQSITAQSTPLPIPPIAADTFSPSDPAFSTPIAFDPALSFGSEAANLEYSILSAILGKTSPDSQHDSISSPPVSAPPTADFTAAWAPDVFVPTSATASGFETSPGALYTGDDFPGSNFLASPALRSAVPPMSQPHPLVSPLETSLVPATQPLHPLAPRWPAPPVNSTYVFGPAAFDRENSLHLLENGRTTRGDEVYASVTKAYDYTEGYHFLMKILPHRFEKNDILRIVRALAIFRPSLIALQMPLTEEDEVFVEKSLQRSIIELDKLISYVGTPTVVWRRTGEICLVGPEFCMLTDWPKEDLLGKRKYIWELFENQSVVEYWENFATHAFENTTQSVYSHCVLLKPDGTPVPATFCFHIRRDIFDLPSLVIGQWLPLL